MFDVGYSEFLVIAIVALVVIGPKELPNVLRKLGRLTGKARAMSRHLRSGFDEMVRQAELEEMEKDWQAHNARIMAEHPESAPQETPALPPDTPSDTIPSDTPPAIGAPPDATGKEETAPQTPHLDRAP